MTRGFIDRKKGGGLAHGTRKTKTILFWKRVFPGFPKKEKGIVIGQELSGVSRHIEHCT